MHETELSAQRVKEIIAAAMSIELGKNIKPENVVLKVAAEMQVLDIYDNTRLVATFKGATIKTK